MKRKIVASLLVAISLMATACTGGMFGDDDIYDDPSFSNDDYGNTDEDFVTERELTQEQIDLLCAISVNEEKVRQGELKAWQKEVLNQYDAAMEYLGEKYPSYDFLITYCEQKNKVNPYTTFAFVEKSEESVYYYDMYVDVFEEESGKRYEIEDNFYGKLFDDELADGFFDLIKEEFPECINVTTHISTTAGKEFGENLDIERVLSGELKMYHSTDFYINAEGLTDSEYEEKVAQINAFILETGIYGSYDVKFVKESDPEEVLYMGHFFGE